MKNQYNQPAKRTCSGIYYKEVAGWRWAKAQVGPGGVSSQNGKSMPQTSRLSWII
ncbi:MAG: hypothetical protein ABR964_10375 [Tepidisphaeraceae bacterium]